jgi:hypothetical protein
MRRLTRSTAEKPGHWSGMLFFECVDCVRARRIGQRTNVDERGMSTDACRIPWSIGSLGRSLVLSQTSERIVDNKAVPENGVSGT